MMEKRPSSYHGVPTEKTHNAVDEPSPPPIHSAFVSQREPHNKSLKLTPYAYLWFVGGSVAGVRFALMIRRGSLALC